MNDKHKRKLIDLYDDAVFALLMDKYAESEGSRLQKEFEDAMASGEVLEVPTDLDQKCRKIIYHNFSKQRRKRQTQKVLQFTCKVAVFILIFLGLSLTTVLSVEALRIPFLNYFIKHQEKYSSISVPNSSYTEYIDNTNPLGTLLPSDYQILYVDDDDMNSEYTIYQNSDGDIVRFYAMVVDGEYSFDTEDATHTMINLLDYNALLISENGYEILWMNGDTSTLYSFSSTCMEKDEFLTFSEALALALSN